MSTRSLGCAFLLLALACDAARDSRPPDLLLITLDTLRADHLEAYGAPPGSSPAIDRLAGRSVVFDRMVAASSRTAPSHASIFTSRFPSDHSIGYANGSTRLEGAETLASLLASAGYETAAFVSNSMLKRRIGLDHGFDHYDDSLPDAEANRPVFERIAEKTVEVARSWLSRPRTRPRFVWVHFNDPHGPYTPPPAYLPPASPAAGPALPALSTDRGLGGIPAYQVIGDERRPSAYRERYAGEIRYVDAAVGLLIEAFRATAGRGGIVALTADHGEALGEEGIHFSHGFGTAPHLAHVPFILFSEAQEPRRVAGLAHHVDILPTLLGALKLRPPEGLSGIDLVAASRRLGALPATRTLFVDVGEEVSAYRGDRFVRARFGPTVGSVEAGSRVAYRWESTQDWVPIEPDPALVDQVDAYARERAPFMAAPPIDAEDAARLRALGYVVP